MKLAHLGLLALLPLLGGATVGAATYERPDVVPPQFFGLVMHRALTTTAWPPVAFGSWRLWDNYVRWTDLEPSRNGWRFADFDRMVALGRDHRVEMLYTLGQTPAWASSRPDEKFVYGLGAGSAPADMLDFGRYVEAVATRYKGAIAAYQVWNEPKIAAGKPCGGVVFFCGSQDELVSLTRSARAALKRADPAARLIGPSFAGGLAGVRHLDQYLEAGAAPLLDAVSFHLYLAQPEEGFAVLRAIRAALARNGVPNLPIWNTEVGYLIQNDDNTVASQQPGGVFSKVLTPRDGAAYLARTMLVSAAGGVERVHWYAWDNSKMGAISTATGKPNEVGVAFGVMQHWLVGSRVRCSGESTEWSCDLQRGGRTATISWRTDGKDSNPLARDAVVERLDGTRANVSAGKLPESLGRPYLLSDGRPW